MIRMILKPNHIKGFKFAYIMNIGSYKKLSGGADYIESVLHRNNVEFKNRYETCFKRKYNAMGD